MTHHRWTAPGHQNLSLVQVLVQLGPGILRQFEQRSQFFPRADMPINVDLRSKVVPHRLLAWATIGHCCGGDHDPVPVGVQKCLSTTIPVRVGGVHAADAGGDQTCSDRPDLVNGADVEHQQVFLRSGERLDRTRGEFELTTAGKAEEDPVVPIVAGEAPLGCKPRKSR